jgi:hypothetical protein
MKVPKCWLTYGLHSPLPKEMATDAQRLLVGKSVGKRQLESPRHMWVDNMLDLGETGGGGVYWIHLAQDRGPVGASCEHGNEPLGFIKR